LGDRTLEGTANPTLTELDRLFPGDSEMARRMRAFDWASHELGPPAHWPQSLKTIIRIILTSRQAMFTWWGKDLVNLYNDAYISVLGGKHPAALGEPAPAVWHEIWQVIGPRAELALTRDEGTFDEALLLLMERNGYTEETYFTFSYSPVVDDSGGFGGIFSPVTEDTQRIIGERQLALLRELSVRTADARTWQDACTLSVAALQTNPHDIYWALIYVIDAETQTAVLAGTTGIEPHSPAAPTNVDLAGSAIETVLWPLREVADTRRPVLLEDLAALPADVLASLPRGMHGRHATSAIALPIPAAGATGKAGILVAGLSPLRLWDDSYRRFLDLATGEIAAAIANGHAYAEERRRAEALAELDRAKTTFFSNVSHEFRTPLTLMLSPLDDLLRTRLPGPAHQQLEMVHRNAVRLLKLVNTLLDFARIEAARLQATFEPSDLAGVTADLASSFRSAIEKAGIRLVVDTPHLPEPVYVDRDMWEKIVLNLLSNAFKFTFEGEIGIELRWCDDHVELMVRDTGTGIPPNELPHVFDRFHRVPNARGRTMEGTGIGLALVKELVRMHGGGINVASSVDQGTVFTVIVPTGRTHLPPERIRTPGPQPSAAFGAMPYLEEALRWLPADAGAGQEASLGSSLVFSDTPSAARTGQDSGAADHARILVADDNADMRFYLRQLLGARWQVETVPDGAAAYAAATADPPDLILSDVMMPGMDGFELLAKLRADLRLRHVPIILLSARAGDEARIEGMSSGADDYMVKPFSGRELLARIQSHLELARVRRSAEQALRELASKFEQQVRRFDAIAGAAEDFIYTFDTSGRFTYASKRLLDLWGTTAEAALGKSLWELNYPDEEAARLTRQIQQVVATRRTLRDETIQLEFVADGAAYEYIFTPIFDADGNVEAVAGISRDTTERRRFEQQLRDSEERLLALSQSLEVRVQERTRELARSNEELDQFAYIASHDLKAPLRAIDHLAAWITQDAAEVLPPVSQAHLDKLRGRIRRMEKLLDDLLAYSRAGRHLHEPEWVDTAALTRDVGFILAPPLGFALQIQSPMPRLFTERVPLETVLRNLIGNAIKHHPRPTEGRVIISVQEQTAKDGSEWVEFTVADNGAGIAPEHHERIFQIFQSLKPRDVVEGSGMGLAVVKKTVENQGGRIEVISDGVHGTSFCFTWPRRTP
jgi:PAS domain S-box-containing protein